VTLAVWGRRRRRRFDRSGHGNGEPRGFAPGAPNSRTLYDDARQAVSRAPASRPNRITSFAAPRIDLVLNWFEELRSKAPSH
jgi:hypothetical protein